MADINSIIEMVEILKSNTDKEDDTQMRHGYRIACADIIEQLRGMSKSMTVEWVEIDSAEDVESSLVGDELVLFDGCDFSIDYVETEVDYGTSFFANGTEATHYLRGLKKPTEK